MYTNQEQAQLNKFLERETFTMESDFFGDQKFEVEYKFKLVGVKKMISVGEYYDYIRVFVTIIDGEKSFKRLLRAISYIQKQDTKVFLQDYLKKEYRFNNQLSNSISDDLKYFSDGKDHVRVNIEYIILSDKLYDDVRKIELN